MMIKRIKRNKKKHVKRKTDGDAARLKDGTKKKKKGIRKNLN